jgi:uncharacterized surface protein with fasciclin (FAS1) repeats
LVALLKSEQFEEYDFSILVEAVTAASLAETLRGNRQLIVFAPTDEAFGNLLEAREINAGDLLTSDALADILEYHVTSGRRYASSTVRAPHVETLLGEPVSVDGTVLNDGQAGIVETNLEAGNGVAHVINGRDVSGAGVLLPPGTEL